MSDAQSAVAPGPSAAVRREAAVWIARIHGPDRTEAIEAGLRQWLQESAEHRQAFELASELWESAARLPDHALPRLMRWKRVNAPSRLPRSLLAACIAGAALIVTAGLFAYFRDPVLNTEIGEQRIVTLQDGTRISMNTATRMVVHYRNTLRAVNLESGEALFEVAKRPGWPFVVTSGDRQIRAIGTAFVVRRDDRQTSVTLVEGKVTVNPVAGTAGNTDVRRMPLPSAAFATLSPGDRLTFFTASPPQLDRPQLDKVTAWQHGFVELDHTRLADAVDEMNRYSDVKLAIEGPEATNARISGAFRAGDSLSFAQAVAKAYGLGFVEKPHRIVISATSGTQRQ